jgi:hypothetical protein
MIDARATQRTGAETVRALKVGEMAKDWLRIGSIGIEQPA